MSGLRFAMITTFYPPYHFGGDAVGIQRFVHALARRGHEVDVIHAADAWRLLAGRADPPDDAPVPGVTVHRLESRIGRLSCLLTQQTGRPIVHGRRIRRILDQGRFDVINYHNVSLAGGPGVLALGDAVKLYMAHEHWLVCPSHVLWRHNREPCTGRECLRCVLAFRRPPQIWRYTGLLERNLRHVDAFMAMSAFSRDKHREFGFPREMEVVPYFLPDDPGSDRIAGQNPSAERPFVLFVGRLEVIKGLQDAIPLFHSRPDLDLVVAGDGPYRGELERLAAGLPNVRFLGRVPLEDLAGWYRGARALIVPSVGFETFGIILIEAFRQGTPVIARRLGPFPEIVEVAGGGFLFDSASELGQAIDRLSGDLALRQRLGASARRAYEERWSEDAVLPRFLDVVRKAATRRGARRVIEILNREIPACAS